MSNSEKTVRIYFAILSLLFLSLTGAYGDRPNVLMLLVDDLRPEIGAYGSDVITPNIDKLAASGTLFERAYCNVPVCGASRASLMTGMRPGRHRFLSFDSRADEDAPHAVVLSKAFQNAGYKTVSLGKVFHEGDDCADSWDERSSPKATTGSSWRDYLVTENQEQDGKDSQRGPAFEKYEGDELYRDEKLASQAVEALRSLAKSDRPFFLATGFFKPHLPFNAPAEYWNLYDFENVKVPENYVRYEGIPKAAFHNSGEIRSYAGVPDDLILPEEYARQLIHGYYAATSFVDAQIGRVVDELEALGLREKTIIILMGDHGYNLGEHTLFCKHCNFHHALHIPLVLDAPGLRDGQRTDALAELVDVYPTLAELAGIKVPPDQLEGRSLVPLLNDLGAPRKKFIISKYMNGISIVTAQHIYTEWQHRESGETYAQTLFDLKKDPLETQTLVETNKSLAIELSEKLRENWGKSFDVKP